MKNKGSGQAGRDESKMNSDNLHSVEALLKQLGLTESVFEPSEDSVARLNAIPLLYDEPRDLATTAGAVTFDSWSQGSPVALRDAVDGYIRRVRLQAGKTSVEIVAEMNKGRWEFVARVYRGKSVVHDFVLNVGRKKLLSESGGFYRWSSKTVPHKISLTSLAERLTFESLSW